MNPSTIKKKLTPKKRKKRKKKLTLLIRLNRLNLNLDRLNHELRRNR